MSVWKNRFIVLIISVLGISFLIFLFTGYVALYWAWARNNLDAAQPYLPWARNFGMLAMVGAAVGLGVLFSSKAFPVPPRTRLLLSFLTTATIGFFSEFRNEGKFHFKSLYHFWGPHTWVHDLLNQIVPSLGDFLYRMEYSHWNDFLMGPAIVSILFALVLGRIYRAFEDRISFSLRPPSVVGMDLDRALRFARILMNVGLFWFFCTAWAEKSGYLSNPFSSDEIDLPFEFAGTIVGFWMARTLTKPFDERPEKFRSTLLIDFLSSGVIGLLYTLIVGPLTEGLAWDVGHALYPAVPPSLDIHEYTPFQRHTRPLELLLLAAATWWCLNWTSKSDEIIGLSGTCDGPDADCEWSILKKVAALLAVTIGYLVILAMMFSLLEPQGLGWTLTTAGAALLAGTVAFLLVKRAGQQGLTRIIVKDDETLRGRQ